jgi:putative methionine-R-sulfoxide reductase with GAF domain
VKTFRSSRCLLADIDHVLSGNRPSFHHSPLEQVADLLIEGRHYSWVGVYLSVDDRHSPPLVEDAHPLHPGQIEHAGTRKKIVISMKIAGREVGHLSVESEREYAFGGEERVLLEQVAGLLARFLTGPGKYLVLAHSRSNDNANHGLKRRGVAV